MKKFLIASFLTLPLSGFLIGQQTPQVSQGQEGGSHSPRLKMIEEVLADYHAGCYRSFLQRSDADFQKSQTEWKNIPFLEQRKKLSKAISDQGLDKKCEFKQKIVALQEAQDQELLEIALNHPNEKISREVRDMIFFSPSKEEEKSIEFVHALSLKSKGDGNSPIENKLIAIDTEFWIKTLALEISKAQNKIDQDTFQKQLLVLHLEKIRQMRNACEESGNDQETKSCVETAAAVLPKLYASAATRKYLNALGKKKVAPRDSLEQEFQRVMVKYLEKEGALVEKCFPKEAD